MITHLLAGKNEKNTIESTLPEEQEKLAPIMKAIKAIRSNGGTADPYSVESLEKQRHNQELLAKLVTPTVTIDYERSAINQGPHNRIPIEWARPEFAHRKDKIIVYCHGGGFTCGGLGYAGILAGKLAFHTGLEVLTFEYRLAPENPYPAAIRDAVSVWDYLMHIGYGADDIILAGDSAGGNMALELTLGLKKQKRKLPAALILMSPWTDMTVSANSYEKFKDLDPMLTKEYVIGVRDAYIYGLKTANKSDGYITLKGDFPTQDENEADQNIVDYSDPAYSPLYADLSEMPPVYIQVGSNEILRDDSSLLYDKLTEQGGYAKLDIYEGGWHVFQQIPSSRAVHALNDVSEFINIII